MRSKRCNCLQGIKSLFKRCFKKKKPKIPLEIPINENVPSIEKQHQANAPHSFHEENIISHEQHIFSKSHENELPRKSSQSQKDPLDLNNNSLKSLKNKESPRHQKEILIYDQDTGIYLDNDFQRVNKELKHTRRNFSYYNRNILNLLKSPSDRKRYSHFQKKLILSSLNLSNFNRDAIDVLNFHIKQKKTLRKLCYEPKTVFRTTKVSPKKILKDLYSLTHFKANFVLVIDRYYTEVFHKLLQGLKKLRFLNSLDWISRFNSNELLFLSNSISRLPKLRYLKLNLIPEHSLSPSSLIYLFKILGKIRSLEVLEINLGELGLFLGRPNTHRQLSQQEIKAFCDMLHQSPQLTNFHFGFPWSVMATQLDYNPLFQTFQQLRNLISLSLIINSSCPSEAYYNRSLASLSNLESLRLEIIQHHLKELSNQVLFNSISKLERLKAFGLRYKQLNDVPNHDLQFLGASIKEVTTLQSLSLDIEGISLQNSEFNFSHNKALTSLKLIFLKELENMTLMVLLDSMKSLTQLLSLNLTLLSGPKNKSYSNGSAVMLYQAIESLKSLQDLEITFPSVQTNYCGQLGSALKKLELKKLALCFSYVFINDTDLLSLLSDIKEIKTLNFLNLDLSCCENVSVQLILNFSEMCSELKKLKALYLSLGSNEVNDNRLKQTVTQSFLRETRSLPHFHTFQLNMISSKLNMLTKFHSKQTGFVF